MWKKILFTVLLVLTVSLSNPQSAAAAGFKSFVDTYDGYEFLYPNGWLQVKVNVRFVLLIGSINAQG